MVVFTNSKGFYLIGRIGQIGQIGQIIGRISPIIPISQNKKLEVRHEAYVPSNHSPFHHIHNVHH